MRGVVVILIAGCLLSVHSAGEVPVVDKVTIEMPGRLPLVANRVLYKSSDSLSFHGDGFVAYVATVTNQAFSAYLQQATKAKVVWKIGVPMKDEPGLVEFLRTWAHTKGVYEPLAEHQVWSSLLNTNLYYHAVIEKKKTVGLRNGRIYAFDSARGVLFFLSQDT